MTAVAIPSRPERAAARPVPWTRLTWVAWRQQRAALHPGASVEIGKLSLCEVAVQAVTEKSPVVAAAISPCRARP